LERYALKYLRRWDQRKKTELRPLDDHESAAMSRRSRWSVGWAGLAGALSGGILGGTELLLRSLYVSDEGVQSWLANWPYWTLYAVVALVVSGIELLFLYWNSGRSVALMSDCAGISLSEQTDDNIVITRGLARAVLEFPNPREPLHGIDPYARTSRWKLTTLNWLYRVKVGVTSFIFRIFLRRMLSRAALRLYIPLAGIPLFAAWNAWITWRILRQARARVFGPLLVEEWSSELRRSKEHFDPEKSSLLLQSVGEMIIRSGDNHPNYHLLLDRLRRELKISPEDETLDWSATSKGFERLDEPERDILLRSLGVVAVLDGNLARAELRLLEEAHQCCGRAFERGALQELKRRMLSGKGLRDEQGSDASGNARLNNSAS
jgi:hypothetical protein